MMTIERKKELTFDPESSMTEEEMAAGYRWCCEWDGLMIGPEDQEADYCTCARYKKGIQQ